MSLNSISQLQLIGFQQSTMWEFYITDAPENFKFFVVDTTLPFKKLEHETRHTGQKHYTGFTPESEFSITFRETAYFAVYDYFQKWMDAVYDPTTKVFRSGNDTANPKTRTGILAFSRTLALFVERYNQVFQFNRLRILGIDDKTLDYTTVEGLTLTVNFTVDEVTPAPISVLPLNFGKLPINVPLSVQPGLL